MDTEPYEQIDSLHEDTQHLFANSCYDTVVTDTVDSASSCQPPNAAAKGILVNLDSKRNNALFHETQCATSPRETLHSLYQATTEAPPLSEFAELSIYNSNSQIKKDGDIAKRSINKAGFHNPPTYFAQKPTVRFVEPNTVPCSNSPTSIVSSSLDSCISESCSSINPLSNLSPTQLTSKQQKVTSNPQETVTTATTNKTPLEFIDLTEWQPYADPTKTFQMQPRQCQAFVETANQSSHFGNYGSAGSMHSSSSSSDQTRSPPVSFTSGRLESLAPWALSHNRIEQLASQVLTLIENEVRRFNASQIDIYMVKRLVRSLKREVAQYIAKLDLMKQAAFKTNRTALQQQLQRCMLDVRREEEAINLAFIQLERTDLNSKVNEQNPLVAIGASIKRILPIIKAAQFTMQANHELFTSYNLGLGTSIELDSDHNDELYDFMMGADSRSLGGENFVEDDNLGTLKRGSHSETTDESTESTDPPELLGLLHVYAAQLTSHNLLVRGTVDEFLSFLQIKSTTEPRTHTLPSLPTAGVLIAHAKFLLRCASQLVNLVANLCVSLKSYSGISEDVTMLDTEKFRRDVEATGDSVCEALKGLISQTKEVAGYLSVPGHELPHHETTSTRAIISGPEIERLVGAISRVATTTSDVKRLVVGVTNTLQENVRGNLTNESTA